MASKKSKIFRNLKTKSSSKKKITKRKVKVQRRSKPKARKQVSRKTPQQKLAAIQPPIFSEGEVLSVKVDAKLPNGDGVAWVKKGFLFVANADEGQHYKVRVVRAFKKTGIAEIIMKITESEMHHEQLKIAEERKEAPRPTFVIRTQPSEGPLKLMPKQEERSIMPAVPIPPQRKQ